MIRLALAYLRERRLTTALNVLLLAISASILVLLLQFAKQAEERFLDGAQGVDLVVGAKGSPLQLVLSSVYHLDEPTGNIPLGALAGLRSNPTVASAIPLALGDQFEGFRIVGSEPALLELYGAKLTLGRQFAQPLEVVIGAEVAASTGARIGQRFVGSHGLAADEGGHEHEETPFEVVGILAPTGKPVDRLILTSLESVWDVHGIAHHEEEDAHDHGNGHAHGEAHGGADEPEITSILVTYRSPAAAVRLPPAINRNTVMQAASPARESARMIGLFEPAIGAIRVFGLLLALTGGLAIFVALFNAVRGRLGDLALLRVMGAGRPFIAGTVLLEGAITAALAGVAGIVLAHILIWLAGLQFLSLAEAGIVANRFYGEEAAILLGAVLIGILAALLPAWTVMRRNLAPILNHN